MYDFPSSPSQDQTFTPPGGPTFIFKSPVWMMVSAAYAPLASPTFTGDPKAPTPATADNDTSIATTAYVKAQGYATLAAPTFTGDAKAVTPSTSDNDTSIATTAFVRAAITTYAPQGREKLTTSRQYYVRTDGNDSSGTGLSNVAGTAWLTIQKAYDVISSTIDLNGWDVTVNIAAGTYSAGVAANRTIVGGRIIFAGAGATTIITNPSVTVSASNYIVVNNIQFNTSGYTGQIFYVTGPQAILETGAGIGIDMAAYGATQVFNILDNGMLRVSGNMTYAQSGGSVGNFITVTGMGKVRWMSGSLTLNGSGTMTTFVNGQQGADIVFASFSFTGAFTPSTRMYLTYGSTIDVSTNSPVGYLPGATNGTVDAYGSRYSTFPVAGRELLTTSRTYYVRTDGNDANTGLANTAGGAFLTMAKALKTAMALDMGAYYVNINVADGTYAGPQISYSSGYAATINGSGGYLVSWASNWPGVIYITGNYTTPANVVFTSGMTLTVPATICVVGLTLDGPVTVSGPGARLCFGANMRLNINSAATQFSVYQKGELRFFQTGSSQTFTLNWVSGSPSYFMIANFQATVDFYSSGHFTVPTGFSTANFIVAYNTSMISWSSITFAGAAITGKKFDVNNNSSFVYNSGTLPGDVAGTKDASSFAG